MHWVFRGSKRDSDAISGTFIAYMVMCKDVYVIAGIIYMPGHKPPYTYGNHLVIRLRH